MQWRIEERFGPMALSGPTMAIYEMKRKESGLCDSLMPREAKVSLKGSLDEEPALGRRRY